MSKKAKVVDAKITLQEKTMRCFQCQSLSVRKISANQYFCADCCSEFSIVGDQIIVYEISEDGGLLKIS